MGTEQDSKQPDGRGVFRTVATSLGELVRTVFQALVFFLVFMTILMLSFPEGTGLNKLYGDWVERGHRGSQLSVPGVERAPLGPVAMLTEVRSRVKDRSADAVAWKAASRGMALENRHAVQTLSRSSAAIQFDDDRLLQLSENSLVVVQRSPDDGAGREQDASLVVLGGRVAGQVHAGPGSPKVIEVMAGKASAQIRSVGEKAAEYTVDVNPDKSTTLSIYSGQASVTGDGGTVIVEPQQAIVIVPGGVPGPVVDIPDTPRLLAPSGGEAKVWGETAPSIRFSWETVLNADSYRFVIARDPDFLDVAYEATVEGGDIVFGNVDQETYWWRVTALNGVVRSLPTPSRELRLTRDLAPPELRVELPESVTDRDHLIVLGVTEPNTQLRIGATPVAVAADGSFEYEVALRNGPNLIVVEAIDAAGNVTYRSQYVHASF